MFKSARPYFFALFAPLHLRGIAGRGCFFGMHVTGLSGYAGNAGDVCRVRAVPRHMPASHPGRVAVRRGV